MLDVTKGKEMKEAFTQEQLVARAFDRVARVIFELWEEGRGIHTRVLDWLIPDEFVSVGTSVNGGGHREHLVPCVVIIDHCIELFRQDRPLPEVAREIRRLLKIASITPEEAHKIDHIFRLKTRMPAGWSVGEGDVYARLQAADIELSQDLPTANSSVS